MELRDLSDKAIIEHTIATALRDLKINGALAFDYEGISRRFVSYEGEKIFIKQREPVGEKFASPVILFTVEVS